MALYRLRIVTLPMFVALMLSTLLVPPTRWLEDRGMKSGGATAVTFLSSLGAIGALFYFLGDPVVRQFNDMGPQVSKSIDTIENWLKTGPLKLSDTDIAGYIDKARDAISTHSDMLQSGITQGATVVIEVVIGIFVTLIMTFFFTKDGSNLTRPLTSRVRNDRRELVGSALRRAYAVLGGYLRGVAMTGVVDAVCIGIGLVILGVPFVAPLVVLTFFGAFFPLVGATVAGALAALIALVTVGVWKAVLVVLLVLLVQQLEGHLLQPLLVGRAVELHPIVILFSLSAGSIIAGLLGGFIAVPLVAMTIAVYRHVESTLKSPNDKPPDPDNLDPAVV